MKQYVDLFSSWEDVKAEFSTSDTYYKQQGCYDIDPEKEPEHVYAFYNYEDYNGDAYVAYYENEKFYLVQGSHCSCHGLEGQWEPEEYTPETFKGMLARVRSGEEYGLSLHKAELMELFREAIG